VLCRDFNARVGKQPIGKTLGTNGENTLNENGRHLINVASLNGFKIKNTFFLDTKKFISKHGVPE
jgi:hypothetical protein